MFCTCSVSRGQFLLNMFLFIVITSLITLSQSDRVVSGIIHFCIDEIGYSVSAKVCPGGIRFLDQAFRPDFDCVCSAGIFLAPGAIYEVGSSVSTPVFVHPKLECRLWKQGYSSYDSSEEPNSSEKECRKEPWKALERWFMVPLADALHLEKESIAMWRGVDDKSIYDLEDFRLFTMDSSGRIRVPLENDFQGYFTYYKGVGNVSNSFQATEIQIGQYCMNIGGTDENNLKLLYMNRRSLRFDNTSIKYGCSRNSIKMSATGFGTNREPNCPSSCYQAPFSMVMRYEDLLYQNYRPLPPYEKIIQHFKKALIKDFAEIFELRLNNFRNSKKYLRNYESSPTCLEVLNKAIAVVQKLLKEDEEKKLIENILKVFVIGTGGNLGIQSLESECKELIQLFDLCLENLVPIALEEENSTSIIENTDNKENEKYRKNDLVMEVIKISLNLATAQCLATLENGNRDVFLRIFAKVVNKIYRSPLFHEKFWVMKPWTNEMRICDGFTIWEGAACCLQLDSRHNLVPNMSTFKKALKNGPELCE
ncbi:unnamed protein product [Orchesella dallaii]|uniref:Uncharacterized protein n=1 Tax=Orchesella dallaii TaxID=48710 RepID=A0ABP1Q8Z4_9HEXA